MGVVSFRLPDDDEERLRRAGINPGLLAKAHVEAQARALEADKVLSKLEAFSRPSPEPIADLIRSIREEH